MNDRRVFNVKLLLDMPEDEDLIRALSSAPSRKRAALVKSMLRFGNIGHVEVCGVTEEDMAEAFEGFLA